MTLQTTTKLECVHNKLCYKFMTFKLVNARQPIKEWPTSSSRIYWVGRRIYTSGNGLIEAVPEQPSDEVQMWELDTNGSPSKYGSRVESLLIPPLGEPFKYVIFLTFNATKSEVAYYVENKSMGNPVVERSLKINKKFSTCKNELVEWDESMTI